MGLLAHAKAPSWLGPHGCDDFGRVAATTGAAGPPRQSDDAAEHAQAAQPAPDVDEVTSACFAEAMSGELEAIGFRTEAGFDGLRARGLLWGGNLTVLLSLLGTPHWPKVRGGVLFLEDVNEHPYRVERSLLQLHQAGVLDAQKAVLLGAFSDWRKSPMDRGYTLKSAVAHLRSVTRTPIVTGLPFGHVPTKVCMPYGRRVEVLVQARDVLVGW
jgi:muramoyltetrapeptide carboxypeptidase